VKEEQICFKVEFFRKDPQITNHSIRLFKYGSSKPFLFVKSWL